MTIYIKKVEYHITLKGVKGTWRGKRRKSNSISSYNHDEHEFSCFFCVVGGVYLPVAQEPVLVVGVKQICT